MAGQVKINPRLRHLDLSWCYLGMPGCRELSAALCDNEWLTHLNLSGNDIGALGAQMMAKVLKAHPTLTDVNLFCNNIGSVARTHCLAFHLFSPSPHRTFGLCARGVTLQAKGCRTAERGLFACLRPFVFSSPRVGPILMHAGSALPGRTSMTNPQAPPPGIAPLDQAIAQSQVLIRFNVRYNNLCAEGAAALAKGLRKNWCDAMRHGSVGGDRDTVGHTQRHCIQRWA